MTTSVATCPLCLSQRSVRRRKPSARRRLKPLAQQDVDLSNRRRAQQSRRYNCAVGAPDFASPDFAVPAFAIATRLAVEAGLDAAAILDAKGKPLAVAGALDDDEARAIAAHATRQAKATDLLDR